MKKSGLFLIVLILLSAGSAFYQINGQEKSREDKDKEMKIQMAIEQQKKAMSEQNKAMSDQKKAQQEVLQDLQEQVSEADSLKEFEIEVAVDADGKAPKTMMIKTLDKRGDRIFRFDEPFISAPDGEDFYSHSFGRENESSRWEFSKSVKENTQSRDYSFDVEKSAKSVVMSVMGDCKSGEIRIKIVMPNGKVYSEIVIDEFGNLNWRKSFTISDSENQYKTGEWKFQIASKKATGFFKITLQTY